jgi:hypothetical protein
VSPYSIAASGCSCPVSMRNSVDLPAPLGPITPTMPPGGSEKVRSSISSLSPIALLEPLNLDHLLAQARAVRDDDLGAADAFAFGLAGQFLIGVDPGLLLGLPGLGALARIHSSSRSSVFCLDLSSRASCEPLGLLLQPGGIVALVGNAAAAVEFEDPAGDVVEEIAVVGDDQEVPL